MKPLLFSYYWLINRHVCYKKNKMLLILIIAVKQIIHACIRKLIKICNIDAQQDYLTKRGLHLVIRGGLLYYLFWMRASGHYLCFILPNTSRSKSNQTLKFGQLIKYNTRNIFLKKSYRKCEGETSPRPFFGK